MSEVTTTKTRSTRKPRSTRSTSNTKSTKLTRTPTKTRSARSSKKDSDKYKPIFKQMLVTPEIARQWLAKDEPSWNELRKTKTKEASMMGGRDIKPTGLKKLIRTLQTNSWVFDGKPISKTEGGVILDGRHRLTACAESGISIDTMVWENATLEAYKNMDDSEVRTKIDMLKIYGFSNPTLTKQIITKVFNWASTDYRTTVAKKMEKETNREFIDFCIGDDRLNRAVRYAEQFKLWNKNAIYKSKPDVLGALYYILEDDQDLINRLTDFSKGCIYNNSEKYTLPYKFCSKIQEIMFEQNKSTINTNIWERYFIQAFIRFVNGDNVKALDSRIMDPFSLKIGSRVRFIRNLNDKMGSDMINIGNFMKR